jgi:hypothetical protein
MRLTPINTERIPIPHYDAELVLEPVVETWRGDFIVGYFTKKCAVLETYSHITNVLSCLAVVCKFPIYSLKWDNMPQGDLPPRKYAYDGLSEDVLEVKTDDGSPILIVPHNETCVSHANAFGVFLVHNDHSQFVYEWKTPSKRT